MKKERLDLLVARQANLSRERAQAIIMSGLVMVDNKVVDKSGIQIPIDAIVTIKETFPYVSRGSLKLEKAHKEFGLDFKNKIICDVGASTGGFTDFALQQGAKKVYAVDTGYGQIASKLRDDQRVVLYEKTNIKDLNSLPEPIDFFVIDVSFISLTQVLPAVRKIDPKASVVALVKPQFEVGKEIADKTKGVIRDEKLRGEMLEKIITTAKNLGYEVSGSTVSPISGAKGNKEFLLYIVQY